MELKELNYNEMKEINGGTPITVTPNGILRTLGINNVKITLTVDALGTGSKQIVNQVLNGLGIGSNNVE